MTICKICKSNKIENLMDLGMQPICNKFLRSLEERENKYALVMGLCKDCGLVQLIDPFPANELQPKHDWVTYTEPEEHLDNLADTLARLPNMNKGASICGISFKDDSLLERMKKHGFHKIMRLDLQKDFGADSSYGGVETVQNLLNTARANSIVDQNGKFDLILVRHILEHAYDLYEFIAALKELVKEDGYIMFEAPDYTKPFEQLDYSTIWEEHIVYFTPETFKNCFTFYGLGIERFELYTYPLENSLIAIVKNDKNMNPKFLDKSALEKEISRALKFSQEFIKTKNKLKLFFFDFRKNNGKIIVFGAGHNACLLINVFELEGYIDYVIDENSNKQGLFMPGSHVPIIGSSALLEKDIKLSVFSLNPGVEEKIVTKNEEYIKKGGKFLSFCPVSKYSIYTHRQK